MEAKIESVRGYEILDSRGNPTVLARVRLTDGTEAAAASPSGASTGSHEARELRDGDDRYGGRGVRQAVAHVERELAEAVVGTAAAEQRRIDALLCAADGAEDKSALGANAILAVSLAVAKAAAASRRLPLYRYIALLHGARPALPAPMLNILNGGVHAANTVDIQEFMVLPRRADSFAEGLRRCVEVYHTLGRILFDRRFATGVGDEGGFAPNLSADEEALRVMVRAVEQAGYAPGREVAFALDAAASGWRMEQGAYLLPKCSKLYSRDQLLELWCALARRYPIVSIEDPFSEDDWPSWSRLTAALPAGCLVVGDDLFVTNRARLERGVAERSATAILIKPNQIGTLTETLETVKRAQESGWEVIVSHRSGETEDAAIADLAVGVAADKIKAGAPCRGERTAKYNRLLVIERELAQK